MNLGTQTISSGLNSRTPSAGVLMVSNGGFDPDYQNLLNFAVANSIPLPSPSEQIMNNATLRDAKATGVWQKSDVFYVMINVGSSAFATLNWKNPASFRLAIVNTVTWNNTTGFQGDGVSGHLTTGLMPQFMELTTL